MSNDRRNAFTESFPQRLEELRLKIDSLPEEQRPQFRAAVAEAEQQHNRMQGHCKRIRDMVADLGLIVTHTKFHVEACQRELRQVDPHGRFQL